MHQGHQQARHAGVTRGLCEVEDQLDGPGNEAAVGGHGVVCPHLAPIDLLSQGLQGIEVEQHPGHQGQGGRGGTGARLCLSQEALPDLGFDGLACPHCCLPLGRKLLSGRSQVDAGGAAFVLQGVDQPPDGAHQLDTVGQVANAIEVQLLGAQHERGKRLLHERGRQIANRHVARMCIVRNLSAETSPVGLEVARRCGSGQGDQNPAVFDAHLVGTHRQLGVFKALARAQVEVVLVKRGGHHDVLAQAADQPT